ncbi:beta-lactamase [Robbsia andropogonis]|uniref:Beta-lactamase n=1 Tax=Robbsia andropogonis TaxID=28092 RepID=A0A0F5JZ93_9BURK|nr:hypothetical protein [Robbsia andropogonis]KKB62944.1 beta-lactamase [Robbsia andropogonis]MCP1120300.1 hypothetical protein [Robbsia andropogonis]MCP1130170.1 hypothetical protein [Robbsia andropogonis]
MKLRDIAHSRTGDKGNTLNVSVICHDAKHYAFLDQTLTIARVKHHLSDIVKGDVIRYALPNLAAFNFVLHNALGGGVTRSLALDAHGKSVSAALLDMTLE